MPGPDPRAALEVMEEAARDAGEIALTHFRADPTVWEKSGGAGPVTEADLAVDRHLRERLLKALPGVGWLSEETEDGPERLSREATFIVDPIDGTRAFIEGSRTWAISIALVAGTEPVAAAVHLPARGLTFTARAGGGAAKNGQPIRATQDIAPDRAHLLSAKSNFTPRYWQSVPPRPQLSFRSSLAYRMALVAEGRFDGMLTLRNTWEWDVAAGALLVTEAGGRVATTEGAPRFNSPAAALPGLMAGAAPLIDAYAAHGPRLPA
ncbi:MAG: 3'(2'),5'-bisphosphate nucleotidase CysQ [Pseudomonadota bacterium]